MSQLQRKILFPTAVYFKDIPNAKELNKYLFKEIKKWRKADPKGEAKTNSGFGLRAGDGPGRSSPRQALRYASKACLANGFSAFPGLSAPPVPACQRLDPEN